MEERCFVKNKIDNISVVKLLGIKRGISLVGIPLFFIVNGLFHYKHCFSISLIVS